ncbi:lipoprotein [Collimonas sp.]|uniref:LPS translocon maturation chaperone LptM n=1 Tax=Collimonas sp. TaxID=1963772 RepID=UPI0032631C1D
MFAVFAIPLALTACGQKGPLFMPVALPPPIIRTAPAPAQPDVTSKATPTPVVPAPQETPATPTTPVNRPTTQ